LPPSRKVINLSQFFNPTLKHLVVFVLSFNLISFLEFLQLQRGLQAPGQKNLNFFLIVFFFFLFFTFLLHRASGLIATQSQSLPWNLNLGLFLQRLAGVKVGEKDGSKLLVGAMVGEAERSPVHSELQTTGQISATGSPVR